jgi:imidazolonepropionase-like amidohydrolase
MRRPLAALGVVLLAACGAARPGEPPRVVPNTMPRAVPPEAPWRRALSEAEGREPAPPKGVLLVRGARILVGDGREIARGHVLVEDGKIAGVAEGDGTAPQGATVIDAAGKVVTPGLIDTHSHLGVYPMPQVNAHGDGNEATAPVTAEVRSLESFWPQDPGIERAVAGGVTTIQALPGSANLIGGRSVTLKLRRATHPRAMHFAGAPDGLKMACGENPKRVYGERKSAPSTRMGNLAGQRAAFLRARKLIDDWRRWRDAEAKRLNDFAAKRAEVAAEREERRRRASWCEGATSKKERDRCDAWRRAWSQDKLEDPEIGEEKPPPERNLQLETLAAVLEGRVLVQWHCYRADDMMGALALADEMGFRVRSFHHALEAFKIKDELARREVGVSTWADWWGFKLEAWDGIPENLALAELAGGRPIVHSDSSEGIRRLNQEAAKGLWSGKHAGLAIDEARAIRWITLNPAWALGVHDRTGTLEVGKDADLVVWSGNPFSVYTRAERVFIDGAERWNAAAPGAPSSDFEAAP